jgi:hypothetical protein
VAALVDVDEGQAGHRADVELDGVVGQGGDDEHVDARPLEGPREPLDPPVGEAAGQHDGVGLRRLGRRQHVVDRPVDRELAPVDHQRMVGVGDAGADGQQLGPPAQPEAAHHGGHRGSRADDQRPANGLAAAPALAQPAGGEHPKPQREQHGERQGGGQVTPAEVLDLEHEVGHGHRGEEVGPRPDHQAQPHAGAERADVVAVGEPQHE